MEDGSMALPIVLQIILIMLNAIFASAEIAVISMNETKLNRMAEDGNKKAKRLVKLTEQPARFLATIQVAITLSGFLGSAFAAENFSDKLVSFILSLGVNIPEKTLNSIAVIVITLVLSYLTLVFGELVPKRVAMKKTEKIALGVSGPVFFLSKLFAPIVSFLTFSNNIVLRLMGINPDGNDEDVTEEEIRMMVDAGSETGAIDKDEQEFIQNVFELDDLTAEELATHRTEISILWEEDDIDKWEEVIFSKRYTRYLVCGESEDDVKGVLDTRDYFGIKEKTKENIEKIAIHPPYFVPKTVKADALLRRMRIDGEKLAVVLDEYGGLCGIITLMDLVEQLVGDLGDDDGAPKEILRTGADTWQIYGSAPIRDIEEELGIVFEEDDAPTTFGGVIISELGFIPDDGTCPEVTIDGYNVKVNQVRDHRIGLTTVKKINVDETETVE